MSKPIGIGALTAYGSLDLKQEIQIQIGFGHILRVSAKATHNTETS
jgi:hypothetical protein